MSDSTEVNRTPATNPDPEYIIDNIMPAHEIHLLGGPSGAGKTTLLDQMMMDLHAGKSIFGHASHPVPMCYVSCDRSLASNNRTHKRTGLNFELPMVSLIDTNVEYSLTGVVRAALHKVPDCRFIAVEAIGSLVDKQSDYTKVRILMTEGARDCQRKRITILGTGHTAKVKEGEIFKNPRERFLGSVAWGGFSETMFYIEPTNPEDPRDSNRKVLVIPRNYKGIAIDYAFDESGRLVTIGDIDAELTLDVNLVKQPRGTEIHIDTIKQWGYPSGKSSIYRWIDTCMETGRLESGKKRGWYRVPIPI